MESDINHFCSKLAPFFDLTNSKFEDYKDVINFWIGFDDRNKVISFLLTVISKFLALDSGQAFAPLEQVYNDIIYKCDRKEIFIQWEQQGGKLQSCYVEKAKALQNAILNIIQFMQAFYDSSNSGHLQKMYQRWRVARILTGRANTFEMKLMSQFGMLEVNPQHSPLRKVLGRDAKFAKGVDEIIIDLIDLCLACLGRGSLGQFPSLNCPLQIVDKVSESLIYQRLMCKLQQTPLLMTVAIRSVLSHLINLKQSESNGPVKLQDGTEQESLLPLLNLYTELVTRAPVINKEVLYDAYDIIKPFYLWPYPRCEIARLALDFTQEEIASPGIHYRRRLIAEHNLLETSGIIKPHNHYLLVDGLAPNTPPFIQAFKDKHEVNKLELKKHLLKHVYLCAYGGNFDLVNFEKCLNIIDVYVCQYFEEIMQITEGAFRDESGELKSKLSQQLASVYDRIVQHAIDKGLSMEAFPENESKNRLDEFIHTPIPNPEVKMSELNSMSVPRSTESILRDILTREHLITTSNKLDHSESFQETEKSMDALLAYNMNNQKYGITRLSSRDGIFNASVDVISKASVSTGSNSRRGAIKYSINDETPTKHTPISMTATRTTNTWGVYRLPDFAQIGDEQTERVNTDLDKVPPILAPKPTLTSRQLQELANMKQDSQSDEDMPFRKRSYSSLSRPSKISCPPRSSRSEDIVDNKAILEKAEKIIKIIVVGTDKTIAQVTKAFIRLKHESPNIFYRQYPQIFYIPVSNIEGMQLPFEREMPVPDLILQKHDFEPKLYQDLQSSRGGDIWFGRFISHLDGWYNRNLLLATHACVHLFPQVRHIPDDSAPHAPTYHFTSPSRLRNTSQKDLKKKPPITPKTPSDAIVDLVFSFTREARCLFNLRVYHVEMLDTCGEAKYTIFSQRIELFHRDTTSVLMKQRNNEYGLVAKPAYISIRIWEVAFDGTPMNSVWYPSQRYFSVRALNIPRPGDGFVPNPERAGFEITVVPGQKLSGLTNSLRQRYKACNDRFYHHSYQFEIRAKDRDNHFAIAVDGEAPFLNLTRLVVRPMETVISKVSDKKHRKRSKLSVPIMTFWPVDL